VSKNEGALSRLHRLFDKVQSGVLTADEAMIEVKTLFGEKVSQFQNLFVNCNSSLKMHHGIQSSLSLIDEEWEECAEEPTEGKKRTPRPIPIPQHYRIEIWRESKKDKKHVRVTNL